MPDITQKLFRLDDKVAVVIGGTGELCGAMAVTLAHAGAKVVIAGRNQAKAEARLAQIREKGGEGIFVSTEATKKESLESLLAKTIDAFGRIDILVNGAGVNSATPFLEISEEEIERILDVNYKSVFLACQVFAKKLLEQGSGGSIINVGSMSGLIPLSRVFTYSATKAAVHNLSRNLAREWAANSIRVNTIVPGFFPAEQNKKILTPDRVASIMGHTPMDRFGKAEELAGATLLLASDAAGSFITGHELVVDGGYSAMTI